MKASSILILLVATCLRLPLATAAADLPAKSGATELKRAVIANYAALASAGFQDSLETAKKLQGAVNELLAKPCEETMAAARQAWLSAHQTYSFTETFRFYNGPIDQVEALVNSWPIDASYIDSVADAPDAGIVNDVASHPKISRAVVISLNAKDGKQNISTGYHAIEFLLWGQPPEGRGAGNRSWQDYADGAKNVERRREYLRLVTDLVVEHLETVADAWANGDSKNFRGKFLAKDPKAALADILMGMGALSGPELSGERLTTAYETKERGEQEDCFSNSTCDDLINNAAGIENVFLGHYTALSGEKIAGPGVFDLLKQVDPAFAVKLSEQVTTAVAAVRDIPPPFDQAILGTNEAPNRVAMKKAITALQAQSSMVAQAAKVLSIRLKL